MASSINRLCEKQGRAYLYEENTFSDAPEIMYADFQQKGSEELANIEYFIKNNFPKVFLRDFFSPELEHGLHGNSE